MGAHTAPSLNYRRITTLNCIKLSHGKANTKGKMGTKHPGKHPQIPKVSFCQKLEQYHSSMTDRELNFISAKHSTLAIEAVSGGKFGGRAACP